MKLRAREAEPIGVRGTGPAATSTLGLASPACLTPPGPVRPPDLPFVVAREAVRALRRTTVVAFEAAIP